MQENEDSPIFLARISKFEDDKDEHGCYTHAQVIPDTSPDVVTRPFPINWTIRGNLGALEIKSHVICVRFPDGSGQIIARADGEHTNVFPKDLRVEGKMTVDDVLTDKVNVIGGGISLNSHTHTGVHGETTGPH